MAQASIYIKSGEELNQRWKWPKRSWESKKSISSSPSSPTRGSNCLHDELRKQLKPGDCLTSDVPCYPNTWSFERPHGLHSLERTSAIYAPNRPSRSPCALLLRSPACLLPMRTLALQAFLAPSTTRADGEALGVRGGRILKFHIKLAWFLCPHITNKEKNRRIRFQKII